MALVDGGQKTVTLHEGEGFYDLEGAFAVIAMWNSTSGWRVVEETTGKSITIEQDETLSQAYSRLTAIRNELRDLGLD